MLERVGPGTARDRFPATADVILTLTTAPGAASVMQAHRRPPGLQRSLPGATTNGRFVPQSRAVTRRSDQPPVLTGGYRPRESVLAAEFIRRTCSPPRFEDTYVVASEGPTCSSTHAADHEKIALIKALVAGCIGARRISPSQRATTFA